MKCLVLIVFFIFSQTPFSAPRQTLNTNKTPRAQPSTPTEPVAATSQQNPDIAPKPENNQQSVRVRELPPVSVSRDWADWVLWIFSGLLVGVGFLGVRLAYNTLKAIERQTKATENSVQIIKRQAVSMRRQTTILRESAEATRVSADAARNSVDVLINSERAWVLVETGKIPDQFGPDPNRVEFLEIKPILRNFGKTPARITRVAVRSHQVPTPDSLPPEPEYQRESAVNITLPPDVPLQPMNVLIPLANFTEIRQGNPVLYVYGFVDYLDLGDKERQSRFCFMYYVPSGFVSMERGFYMATAVPETYTRCT
jgi:hypothetical protein